MVARQEGPASRATGRKSSRRAFPRPTATCQCAVNSISSGELSTLQSPIMDHMAPFRVNNWQTPSAASACGRCGLSAAWCCSPGTSHFLNHALGNISMEALARGVYIHTAFWQFLPVTIVFYTACPWCTPGSGSRRCTSAANSAGRRSNRCSLLGLSIPRLVIAHIVGVRIGRTLFDHEKLYPQEAEACRLAASLERCEPEPLHLVEEPFRDLQSSHGCGRWSSSEFAMEPVQIRIQLRPQLLQSSPHPCRLHPDWRERAPTQVTCSLSWLRRGCGKCSRCS